MRGSARERESATGDDFVWNIVDLYGSNLNRRWSDDDKRVNRLHLLTAQYYVLVF